MKFLISPLILGSLECEVLEPVFPLLQHSYSHCPGLFEKPVLMLYYFSLFPASKVDIFGVLFAFCVLVIILFCLHYVLHKKSLKASV